MTHLEEDFLIAGCLTPASPLEQARFAETARSPRLDWDAVLALARINKVEPRLTHVLEERGLWGHVPGPVARTLTTATEAVEVANRARVLKACDLFAELHEAGIDLCLLKGVLFAELLYGDPHYKRMNDVDMLVKVADVPRLTALYRQLGYFPIAERVGERPELNKKVSHHLPPYVSRELDCVFGTQWGLKSPLAGLKIDYPAIWERSEPYRYHGIPVRKLSARDNLFHVCIHLGVFKSGLRDVMDIANLIRSETETIDWPAFVSDVRVARAQSLVVHALTLVQCIDPQPATQAALRTLGPEARGFYLEAAKKKAASRSVLLRCCSGHLTNVEKAVSAFNAARFFPEKVALFGAFWSSILAAPKEDCARMVFDPMPSRLGAARARLLAPAQILRAIAAEIGGPLLAGLFVKSAVDLTTALARWPLARGASQGLEAYARSLGLTLADLQRLQDAIY